MNKLERDLDVLARIARTYTRESEEYRVLEVAGKALLFARSAEVKAEFQRYLADRELSDAEKEHLRKMGIAL